MSLYMLYFIAGTVFGISLMALVNYTNWDK